jgi:hypothetical protein
MRTMCKGGNKSSKNTFLNPTSVVQGVKQLNYRQEALNTEEAKMCVIILVKSFCIYLLRMRLLLTKELT